MLGFATAASVELLTREALFPTASQSEQVTAAAGLAVCLAVATLLGFAARSSAGEGLKDAVLSSMTAVQRSAASLTATTNLDEALDAVLRRTFDREWTEQATKGEDDK